MVLADKPTGPIGLGLMGMTWRPHPQPFEKSIETMKEALRLGVNHWNGGELYGTPHKNSCHLLNAYFTKYPDDASKVVLSLKGGMIPGSLTPDGSEKNVRRSVEECLKVLDGKKSIDLFECARVDHNVPIEDTVRVLDALKREGKIGAISLSEVDARQIRRAASITTISAVEVELSLWATDVLKNGVAATAAELGIPIIAYSPLARGHPARQSSRSQIDPLDDLLERIAWNQCTTKVEVAISWVSCLSGTTLRDGTRLGLIIPIPGATTEEHVMENSELIILTEEEMGEIDQILFGDP